MVTLAQLQKVCYGRDIIHKTDGKDGQCKFLIRKYRLGCPDIYYILYNGGSGMRDNSNLDEVLACYNSLDIGTIYKFRSNKYD